MNEINKLNKSLKYNVNVNNRNIVAAICAIELQQILKYTQTFSEQKFIEQLINVCNRNIISNIPLKFKSIESIVANYKMYSGTVKTSSPQTNGNCALKDGSITVDKLAQETIDFIETRGGMQKNAVVPTLNVKWVNNRTNELSTALNISAEIGDTYTWEGKYIWKSSSSAAEPVDFKSNAFTYLTKDNTMSQPVQKTVTVDSTFNITLIASNNETSTVNSTIDFKYPLYYGNVGKKLTKSLVNSPTLTVSNVTTNESEYFVYKYPKELAALSQVMMNDAFNVIQAFNYSEEQFITDTGKNVTLRVYTSANPGAFTNAKLSFK